MVGSVYGQVLAAVGERERASAVLRASTEAFRKLGRLDEAAAVERLIEQIT